MLEVSDVSLLKEEIKQLKELLAERDETIIQLRESLRPEGWMPPVELNLTMHEARTLALLYKMRGEAATKEALFQTVYYDKLNPPDIKIVDVFVCKMRKKLRPYEITIDTLWGRGYLLTAESVLILDNWGKEPLPLL